MSGIKAFFDSLPSGRLGHLLHHQKEEGETPSFLARLQETVSSYLEEGWKNALKLNAIGDLSGYGTRIALRLLGVGRARLLLAGQILADEAATACQTADRRTEDKGICRYLYEMEGGIVARLAVSLLKCRSMLVRGALLMVAGLAEEVVTTLSGSKMGVSDWSADGLALRMVNAQLLGATGRVTRPIQLDRPLQWVEKKVPVVVAMTMGVSQTMSLRHELGAKQQQQIAQKLGGIGNEFESLYEAAEKRTYDKHGLHFEYAVVDRKEFPYLLSIGSAGLCFGNRLFVMKDFFVHPEVVPELQAKMIELIAVHEYGEVVFGSHHEASLLEFAVAREEGFLAEYLDLMNRHYTLKLRDIALHRMGEELIEAADALGYKLPAVPRGEIETPAIPDNGSLARAKELRDSFRWPEKLASYKSLLERTADDERTKIEEWVERVAVTEQARGYIARACEGALKVPPEGLPFEFGFYSALRGLREDIEGGGLNKDLFQEEVLRADLEARYSSMKAALGIDDHPLFSRTLEQHLEVLALEEKVLEAKGVKEPATKGRREVKRYERAREVLWREGVEAVRSRRVASIEEGLQQELRRVEAERKVEKEVREGIDWWFDMMILTHWLKVAEWIPFRLIRFRVEQEFIWRLASVAKKALADFRVLDDATLQKIVDERLQAFRKDFLRTLEKIAQGSRYNRREIRFRVDVSSLRRTYGINLGGLQRSENEPVLAFHRYLTGEYRKAEDAVERAVLATELKRPWDLSHLSNFSGYTKEVLRGVREGELPEEVGVEVLVEGWRSRTPWSPTRAEILPYLMVRHGLSWDQAVLVHQAHFLNTVFPKDPRDSAVMQGAVARFYKDPPRRLDETEAASLGAAREGWADLLGERLPSDFHLQTGLDRLSQEIGEKGWAKTSEGIDARAKESGIDLDTLIREARDLGYRFSRELYRSWRVGPEIRSLLSGQIPNWREGLLSKENWRVATRLYLEVYRRKQFIEDLEFLTTVREGALNFDLSDPQLEVLLFSLDRLRQQGVARHSKLKDLISDEASAGTARGLRSVLQVVRRFDPSQIDEVAENLDKLCWLYFLHHKPGTGTFQPLTWKPREVLDTLHPGEAFRVFLDCGDTMLEEAAKLAVERRPRLRMDPA